MNPGETYEAQIALMAILNNLWEIWLGGTAAFIVAFHVGRDSITRTLLWIGCVLYILSCLSIVMRYGAYVEMFSRMNQQLVEAGHAAIPMPEWFAQPNVVLTITVFVFGTVSAVYFATSQYRRKGEGT